MLFHRLQYIPNKRPVSNVTEDKLKMIENELNNRQRKRLGFMTPNEVFCESLNRVELRVCIQVFIKSRESTNT